MSRWFRMHTPDWVCEVEGPPFCETPAEWEQERTIEEIKNRKLAALRCTAHLPADAERVDAEAQPKENVG